MPQQTPTPMIDRSQVEQNRYLDYCLENQVEISIILISGTHFIGNVVHHDRKGLLLGGKREDKPARYISKGYIALIRPNKEVEMELFVEYRGMGTFLQRKRQNQALKKLNLRQSNCGPISDIAMRKQSRRPSSD
jgi:sRNA-binding regulator protein Hfq